ncbi:MAG: Gx transporter family protein, partial [Clostridia bacterium]|nr:Gx transporter family protein [Clostridia bacterium]
ALAHNTAQVMVAVLVTHTTALFGYLPWLWLCAVPTGLLIAALHKMIDRALKTGGLTHD